MFTTHRGLFSLLPTGPTGVPLITPYYPSYIPTIDPYKITNKNPFRARKSYHLWSTI
jgi:hypothetical protein